MPKISVVIITFNEEKNIARCLESVKQVADEIVVLDSFSKDRTKEICLSFGVKFHEHAFDGHIQQKNRAITYASNPHILSLDADEALDETLKKSILEIKNNWTHDGYYMNRLTNYCGHWVKHCNWYPDTKMRLWDSRKGSWTGINPHDKYELKDGDKNTKHIKGDILHYSYYSIEDHYKQVEYFTNIASKAFVEAGKKAPFYKLIANPIAKFIDHYLLHLGFLDGKAGYLISKISAYATYLKYKKIRDIYKRLQNNPVIIISRTDSIGDVVLTLPMAGIIKQFIPGSKIIFLGRNYTKDVIALSEHVDEFVSYDDILKLNNSEQIESFKKLNATHIIHVFPVKEIAHLAKKAGVKKRIGTTNRLWHWFTCNVRISLSRKNSDLHEAQLNTKLLIPFGITKEFSLEELVSAYGFTKVPALEKTYLDLIDETKTTIILHPKSKGSAREWGLDNFSQLISQLDKTKYQIFISGTAQEGELVKDLITKHPEVINLTGKLSLQQFIAFINHCDVLIAASTGPLHIASALGKKAIGLFAPMRPIHPGRWKPIGKQASYLVLDKDCSDCRKTMNCHCIREIKINEVIKLIEK